MERSKIITLISLLLLKLNILLANPVLNPGENIEYADSITNTGSNSFTTNQYETVDPFSGTLKLFYKDFSVKVAHDLEVAYTRSYISDVYGGDLFLYDKHAEYNYISQSWSFHQGYIRFPKNCQGDGNSCKPVFMTGNNERIVLLADKDKPGFYKTANNWRGGKVKGDFVLIAPNGHKYYFNHNYDLVDSSRKYLTRIETPDGSFVKYNYWNFLINKITTSNPGQEIKIDIEVRKIKNNGEKGKVILPRAVYYNNRLVAQYDFGGIKHNHITMLTHTSAKLANGMWWNYGYKDIDLRVKYNHSKGDKFYKEILTSIKDATGGSNYEYMVDWGTRVTIYVGGLRLKKITRANQLGVENGTWSFQYLRGAAKNSVGTHVTNITNNYYSIVNRYYGFQNQNLWQTGLLVDSVIYKDKAINNGNIIQKEEYEWSKTLHNNEPYNINVFLADDGSSQKRDSKTYKPLLKSKKITRDGAKYLTEYTNYNDYGAPLDITVSNEKLKRSIKQEYIHHEQDNILNLPSKYSINNKVIYNNSYDDKGHVVEEESLGKKYSYQYDSHGNMIAKTNPIGMTEHYSDHKFGIVQHILYPDHTEESKQIDDKGSIVSSTDRNNNKTSYRVDDFGRIKEKKTPLNLPSIYSYPMVNKSIMTMGGYTEETTSTGFGLPLIKNIGSKKQVLFLYDALGRKVFQSLVADPNDKKSTLGTYTRYDSLNRVTKECFNQDFSELCTQYEYLTNNKLKITHPNGEYKVIEYISYDSIDDKKIVAINEHARSTVIKRDHLGYVEAVTQGDYSKNYQYDDNYNLIQYTEPETGDTQYSYDKLGNIIETNKFGKTIKNIFDSKNNRLLRTNYSDTSPSVSYDYDSNGNVIQAKKGRIVRFYNYDAENRLIAESLVINKYKNFAKYQIKTPIIKYNYNNYGHLSGIAYPDSSVLELNPNEYGQAGSLGRYASSINYHSNGLIKSYQMGNNTGFKLGLDSYNRASKYQFGGIVIDYQYDSNNNLKQFNILDDKKTDFNHELSFSYDLMGRLVKSTSPWDVIDYSYDSNDNIINIKESVIKNQKNAKPNIKNMGFTYNNLRLTGIKDSSKYFNNIVDSFNYDNFGNIKSDNYHSYTYGIDGNLHDYTGWNGSYYEYDHNNHRVINNKRGSLSYKDIVSFYNKGGDLLYEYDFTSNKFVKYIYLNGHKLAKEEKKFSVNKDKSLNVLEPEVFYYYNDAIGSPVAMADSKGDVLWREVYKPYGGSRLSTKDKKAKKLNKHWFAGKEVDANELSYFGARYYNTTSGRFMSPDPIAVNPEKPTTFNRYAYANNNPYKYVDPDGELPFAIIGIAVLKLVDIALTGYDMLNAYRNEGAYGAGKELAFAGATSVMPGGKIGSRVIKHTAAKTASSSVAHSAVQYSNLKEHLRQLEKYGESGYKELENGRIRYYGELKSPRTEGEMKGARFVREWNPENGFKRNWYETLDGYGTVRSVAPKPETHNENHLIFDRHGNYTGRR